MLIHNWFSDVVISVKYLFDHVVFIGKKIFVDNYPQYFIKHYEFSLANRTFVLSKDNFTTNFKFPTCIITLGEDTFLSERPNISQSLQTENYNQIPILYDNDNKTTIWLQEDHTSVSLSIQINCESQLQAKEVEFAIKRKLPPGKYIQIFEFTSFLEIQPEIMVTLGMDCNNNEVINLLTRLNKNTGDVEYFYSVRYRPIVRLESISSSTSDMTSSSFQVNIELTYVLQFPIWIFGDKLKKIEEIAIDFTRFGNEPISFNSCKFINSSNNDKIRMNILIQNLNDYDFKKLENDKFNDYVFSITFNKKTIIFNNNMKYNIIDINGTTNYNILFDLNKETNTISFSFNEMDYIKKYNAKITNPIILQIIEKRS